MTNAHAAASALVLVAELDASARPGPRSGARSRPPARDRFRRPRVPAPWLARSRRHTTTPTNALRGYGSPEGCLRGGPPRRTWGHPYPLVKMEGSWSWRNTIGPVLAKTPSIAASPAPDRMPPVGSTALAKNRKTRPPAPASFAPSRALSDRTRSLSAASSTLSSDRSHSRNSAHSRDSRAPEKLHQVDLPSTRRVTQIRQV